MSYPYIDGYMNKESGFWSELAGSSTSLIPGIVGGATVGGALGGALGDDRGAVIGGVMGSQAGAYLPILVSSVLALTTDTRNAQEQAEADQTTWKNLLVPGTAAYNLFKREGYSIRNPELQQAQLDLKKERKDKKQED